MDKFDRNIQRDLLLSLYNSSPVGINQEISSAFQSQFGGRNNYIANIKYLEEHGLIISGIREVTSGGFSLVPEKMKITSKGIDFIRGDGGLSAILNLQTIKFHREAVVVLEDLIAISNMNDEQKEKAKNTLGELSTEALKTMVQAATTAWLSVLLGK